MIFYYILYSLASGLQDGFFFSHNHNNCNARYPFNIHWALAIPRVISAIPIFFYTGLSLNILVQLIIYMCVFSFLHNSAYYELRRYLEPERLPHYNWRYQSETTIAKLSMNFPVRTVMMIVGMSVFLLNLIVWKL